MTNYECKKINGIMFRLPYQTNKHLECFNNLKKKKIKTITVCEKKIKQFPTANYRQKLIKIKNNFFDSGNLKTILQ